jgi:DNA-binding PadR family transcriptional regulator
MLTLGLARTASSLLTPPVYFVNNLGNMPQMLGEFELMVLLAVLRSGEDAYGTTIVREIRSRTKRSVTRGSAYVTLDRLERKGLLSSQLGEPTPVRGGRAKRFFRVTRKGLRELKQSLTDLERLRDGLEEILESP